VYLTLFSRDESPMKSSRSSYGVHILNGCQRKRALPRILPIYFITPLFSALHH